MINRRESNCSQPSAKELNCMAFGKNKRSSWVNRPLSMVMPEGAKLFAKQFRKLPSSTDTSAKLKPTVEKSHAEVVDPTPGHLPPPTPALSTASSSVHNEQAPFLTLNLDKAESSLVPNCYLDDGAMSRSESDQSVHTRHSSSNSLNSNADFDRKVFIHRGVYIFDPSSTDPSMAAEETYNPFDEGI